MMGINLSVYSKMTDTIIKATIFSVAATTITTLIFK
jgi:hypothetical protein